MSHPLLVEAMLRQPALQELLQKLPGSGNVLRVGGLAGSAPSLLLAALSRGAPNRVWVAVGKAPPEADAVEADLQSLMQPGVVAIYPQRETLPYEAAEHHLEVSGLRVEALEALLTGRTRILVTTARALQERAEIPSGLAELRLTLRVGQSIRPLELTEQLEAMGFERAPLVEEVGEFAQRGGILDLFGFGAPDPVRLEFWGDDIISIRAFDILDQRSTNDLVQVDILPVDLRPVRTEGAPSVRRSLLDVLPRDTVIVDMHGALYAEEFQRAWDQVLHLRDAALRRGGHPEEPAELFMPPDEAIRAIGAFGSVVVGTHGEVDVRFAAREVEAVDRDMETLGAILRAGAARGEDTFILCDNAGQLERLEEIIGGKQQTLPPRTVLALGPVAHGFILEGAQPIVRVLTDHEIFRRDRRLRRGRRFRGAVALESLAQLKPGDHVVHLDHGVGRFMGLQRVRVLDQEIEALAIEYAGGEILRVPVYRLDLIERWSPDREENAAPKLHKIGGRTWKTLRAKTEKAIQAMAAELIELYAQRQMSERDPYSPDTRWQKELESGFLYEDTPDQRQATADVKRDMESRHPMDRLLCGDVGYGKTEIAVRAAFKAVQDGRQVAVLAPTTILVEQHMHTFEQRLANFPVKIAALSRFRSASEQQEILVRLAAGDVDIIIGTHALLEPDVMFKNLGMLIVDEEQRFGVKQKDRFKEMKHNVDVLSLTATPIPRTLHLSLAGMRDLTLIQTPPRDRMPILTNVIPWLEEVLEDAIRRELDRGGQVFFVHNRVQSIQIVAERVKYLVPDATIGIAHGQMAAHELDDVMRRFLDNEVKVLVTTAIIENGLDVPSANTLIVDRADQFGLAQLYQLRGRVGRSHHRAYCYLVVPDDVNEEAERRLRILEHFTELGSGYAIALKDLELRGAGNILGGEQSGFVHAIGLDTYTRLLEDAIRRIKGGETAQQHAAPEVSVDGPAYLPDEYVPEASQKLHLYRRLSRAERAEQVIAMHAEMRDRFGPPPPEVERLLTSTRLRLLGTQLGVERILLNGDEARVNFRSGVAPRLTALQGALRDQQLEVEVRRANPLSIVLRRHGSGAIAETLAEAFAVLTAAHARAA